jgi:hypothetical protein
MKARGFFYGKLKVSGVEKILEFFSQCGFQNEILSQAEFPADGIKLCGEVGREFRGKGSAFHG